MAGRLTKFAGVAQFLERRRSSPEVVGGKPTPRSIKSLWPLSPMHRRSINWLAVAVFGTGGVSILLLVLSVGFAGYLTGKGLLWP